MDGTLPLLRKRVLTGIIVQAGPNTNTITLAKLRAVLTQDAPIGNEIAQACEYNPKKLAELCGCSRDHLERVFREFGLTPTRWLQEQVLLCCLRRLQRLRAEGQLGSIKQAVWDLGYRHPSNFDRIFKRTFGMSPTVFLDEWESALKTLGIDLTECQRGRGSFPIIDLPMPIFDNGTALEGTNSRIKR